MPDDDLDRILKDVASGLLDPDHAKKLLSNRVQRKRPRGRPRKPKQPKLLSNKKRGRPRRDDKQALIFILWGYFTYGIPDAGCFRKHKFRQHLREWIATYMKYKDVRMLDSAIATWNKFHKQDQQFFQYLNEVLYLHFTTENGEIIHCLEQVEIVSQHTGAKAPDPEILKHLAPLILKIYSSSEIK